MFLSKPPQVIYDLLSAVKQKTVPRQPPPTRIIHCIYFIYCHEPPPWPRCISPRFKPSLYRTKPGSLSIPGNSWCPPQTLGAICHLPSARVSVSSSSSPLKWTVSLCPGPNNNSILGDFPTPPHASPRPDLTLYTGAFGAHTPFSGLCDASRFSQCMYNRHSIPMSRGTQCPRHSPSSCTGTIAFSFPCLPDCACARAFKICLRFSLYLFRRQPPFMTK